MFDNAWTTKSVQSKLAQTVQIANINMIIHSYISLRIHAQNFSPTNLWKLTLCSNCCNATKCFDITSKLAPYCILVASIFIYLAHWTFDVVFDSGKSVNIAHKRWQNLHEDSWKYVCQFVCSFKCVFVQNGPPSLSKQLSIQTFASILCIFQQMLLSSCRC